MMLWMQLKLDHHLILLTKSYYEMKHSLSIRNQKKFFNGCISSMTTKESKNKLPRTKCHCSIGKLPKPVWIYLNMNSLFAERKDHLLD